MSALSMFIYNSSVEVRLRMCEMDRHSHRILTEAHFPLNTPNRNHPKFSGYRSTLTSPFCQAKRRCHHRACVEMSPSCVRGPLSRHSLQLVFIFTQLRVTRRIFHGVCHRWRLYHEKFSFIFNVIGVICYVHFVHSDTYYRVSDRAKKKTPLRVTRTFARSRSKNLSYTM